MGRPSLKGVAEVVTSVGVIVSLVFVGYEVRQNTAATRAGTQQAVYASVREATDALMANDRLIAILTEAEQDSTLYVDGRGSPDESLLSLFQLSQMNEIENAYYQAEQGTLDSAIWPGWLGHINELAGSPVFRHYWARHRVRFSLPGFVSLMDSVVASRAHDQESPW
jgi:hypothetical protein